MSRSRLAAGGDPNLRLPESMDELLAHLRVARLVLAQAFSLVAQRLSFLGLQFVMREELEKQLGLRS